MHSHKGVHRALPLVSVHVLGLPSTENVRQCAYALRCDGYVLAGLEKAVRPLPLGLRVAREHLADAHGGDGAVTFFFRRLFRLPWRTRERGLRVVPSIHGLQLVHYGPVLVVAGVVAGRPCPVSSLATS